MPDPMTLMGYIGCAFAAVGVLFWAYILCRAAPLVVRSLRDMETDYRDSRDWLRQMEAKRDEMEARVEERLAKGRERMGGG